MEIIHHWLPEKEKFIEDTLGIVHATEPSSIMVAAAEI
jgi:hypothetical protein